MKSLKIIISTIVALSIYTTIVTQPKNASAYHEYTPVSHELVDLKKQEGYIGVITHANTILTLLLLASFVWATTTTSFHYLREVKLFLSSFIPILKQRFNLYPRVFNSRLMVFFP
ncbi:hypothetical protein [Ammoniphilus sp. YIM 78166]|uniref:hypothetical protein n=1 Tax=Ammoniphilus sp. YIM 78166 TaxID=1644106 RepID=UPI00107066F6|nr:hypothetical protein [Ammoniphilus sp. YIM 78166]